MGRRASRGSGEGPEKGAAPPHQPFATTEHPCYSILGGPPGTPSSALRLRAVRADARRRRHVGLAYSTGQQRTTPVEVPARLATFDGAAADAIADRGQATQRLSVRGRRPSEVRVVRPLRLGGLYLDWCCRWWCPLRPRVWYGLDDTHPVATHAVCPRTGTQGV